MLNLVYNLGNMFDLVNCLLWSLYTIKSILGQILFYLSFLYYSHHLQIYLLPIRNNTLQSMLCGWKNETSKVIVCAASRISFCEVCHKILFVISWLITLTSVKSLTNWPYRNALLKKTLNFFFLPQNVSDAHELTKTSLLKIFLPKSHFFFILLKSE